MRNMGIRKLIDGGELTRNTNQKKKPDVSQAYECPPCDKCVRREYFLSKHGNIVNHLGKHGFLVVIFFL